MLFSSDICFLLFAMVSMALLASIAGSYAKRIDRFEDRLRRIEDILHLKKDYDHDSHF